MNNHICTNISNYFLQNMFSYIKCVNGAMDSSPVVSPQLFCPSLHMILLDVMHFIICCLISLHLLSCFMVYAWESAAVFA